MKPKKIILSAIAVLIICGGFYGYKEFNRKVKDLGNVKADIILQPGELVNAFENDEKSANDLYLDKIISVPGKIKAIEKDDKGQFTIVLGESGSMSSVRCSMDADHIAGIELLSEGDEITMKGACTGFNGDELLGSDVILNRCVIQQ